jgi:hypothetical protein
MRLTVRAKQKSASHVSPHLKPFGVRGVAWHGVTVVPVTFADRFIEAFKSIERQLGDKWCDVHSRDKPPALYAVLSWAERNHRITGDTAEFLHACRQARNAYAHVTFAGYTGPITLPPEQVVLRLERINEMLRSPALLYAVAPLAEICSPFTPLRQALATMSSHDFTQLPYRHPDRGWELITRDQVARWVEVESAIDGTASLDLDTPVRSLADDSRIKPAVPNLVSPSTTVPQAVTILDTALRALHTVTGGYPVLLIPPGDDHSCKIVNAYDLPRLNALLGR